MYGHKTNRDRQAQLDSIDKDANALHEPFNSSLESDPGPALTGLLELGRLSRRIVAFTGAGISTESGIPDYRGPGGVWERNDPPTLRDFRENPETRRRYWEERRLRYPDLAAANPNAGHLAIVRLEQSGRLVHVVTQNIDGLHQKAGSNPRHVSELHGSAHRIRCLDCGSSWSAEVIQKRLASDQVPTCAACGGMLRAATVLFGQAMPEAPLRAAISAAEQCDLMLVVGSSLIVQPAARIPEIARSSGARLAIVNNESTPLDPLADIVVRAQAGAVLTALADAVAASNQLTGVG